MSGRFRYEYETSTTQKYTWERISKKSLLNASNRKKSFSAGMNTPEKTR
jgi:hypothetical protein